MDNKEKNISLFGISFKQGFISPNVPIVTVTQNGKKLHFLLDTGCDNNVINKEALECIEHTEKKGKTNLTGLGGSQAASKCDITFVCEDQEYTEEFLVSDLTDAFGLMEDWHSIKLCGMLGSCFLRNNNLVLDFETLTLYSKKPKEAVNATEEVMEESQEPTE